MRQKKENDGDSFILDHCTKRDLKNMNHEIYSIEGVLAICIIVVSAAVKRQTLLWISWNQNI